jgi:predicted dehydrogenase
MSTTTSLRVGFVGAGWTQRVQIPVFRLGGLAPSAICAGHIDNAQRAATEHDIPHVYATWQELIESNEVDIVSVVTPPALHREIAVAALQAGKHVIAEKPAALNEGEAEAMLAAAQAAPDQLAIIDHELRFHPARLQMRELLHDGYIGNLVNIEFIRHGAERIDPRTPWNWFSDADQGGGMLFALGSHLLDLARWMVGRIEMMAAQLTTMHPHRTDPERGIVRTVTSDDHARLMLRFANGATGAISAGGITPGPRGMSIRATGTHGALWLDENDKLWGMQANVEALDGEDSWLSGKWQPIRVMLSGLNVSALPVRTPFAIGSFFLSQTLAVSIAMGETVIPEAANFYDGLVIQRMLDAARVAHEKQRWTRL